MKFKKSLEFFKFCPACGEKFALKKLHGQKQLACPRCSFVFYQNSKPTVAVLINDAAGRLLFVRRGVSPKKGWWDFPGGFLEEGEDPLRGVHREIREELGVSLKNIRLSGLYMDYYEFGYLLHSLNIIYTATIAAGSIKPMDDVAGMRWFNPHTFPKNRLAFPRWMKPAIRDWIRGR